MISQLNARFNVDHFFYHPQQQAPFVFFGTEWITTVSGGGVGL